MAMQQDTETTPDTGTSESAETGAEPTKPETIGEKAKRERDTWPYRILEVGSDAETMRLVPGVQFDERRKAEAWVKKNGAEGKLYVPATMPEDAQEVVPKSFRPAPLKGARKASEG